MRITQLDLLAYGKFTARRLDFAAAPRDFHLVIGANEAGKSTTRSAILDLLYGIENRSTFDFLHAKPELRLGATISQGAQHLSFVRAKARLKTLFGADGQPLGESALAGWLGGADRDFYDQMFGLDHARLAAGGQAILSAKDDIGQILFQSAAGIGSLGAVRDQLAAEADGLWAKRRSGERAYTIASDELAQAEKRLKDATVRTKDWLDAGAQVQEIEQRRERSRGRYRSGEAERIALERVRRVAPALRQLREQQAAQRALGEVLLLPADAGRQLADIELELAAAGRDQQLYAAQRQRLHGELATITVDVRLLRHAADITALAERRQQVRHHARDIDRRQLEVDGHWQQVAVQLRQLGWPAAPGLDIEADLVRRLPALPLRSAVLGFAKRFDLLDQTRQASAEALRDRLAELAALQAPLAGLAVAAVPPALRVALSQARALGDNQASLARDAALLARGQREQAAARVGLGRWVDAMDAADAAAAPPVGLLPSSADIAQRLQRQAETLAEHKALAAQRLDLLAGAEAQALAITQYRDAHHPVSAADLAQARALRDADWRGIKSGALPLAAAALGFERLSGAADELADQRHDKAREAGELQARLDALARLQQQADENLRRLAAKQADSSAQAAAWAADAAGLGLPGLALHEVEAWRAARERWRQAAAAVADAQQALAGTRQAGLAMAATLSQALAAAGVAPAPDSRLEALVWIAAEAVDGAVQAQTRRDALLRQQEVCAAVLARQQDKDQAAQAALDAWGLAWREATLAAGLDPQLTVMAAEAAVGVMAAIDDQLRQIHELRQARIETMARDLRDFDLDAASLVAASAPELAALAPAAAADELALRLADAIEARKSSERLARELATAQAEADRADERLARAGAKLQPLLHQAQVTGHDALRGLIHQSDQGRGLAAAAEAALHALEQGGDGLTLAALEAEVAATPVEQLPVRMAELARQAEVERAEQDRLTAELTDAAGRLAQIAGQDDAARAESQRQQALAAMANAAERYITVHTASRLLKWAIDRYRETRQGPMLLRAGEIFAALTLGSFQRLTVDFESEPATLHGLRADGTLVGTAGFSEGTRDQLYLALRLAALELHLGQGNGQGQGPGQGQALPFIADDLFINYDDLRARAGLEALARLSEQTQVIFLSHHDHLVPAVRAVFGAEVNVLRL